jgi:hypothetical protein
MDDREARVRAAVRRALKRVPWLFSKEGNRQFYRSHMEAEDPKFLVAAAREGDDDAIDILRDYVRGARQAGINVPTVVHEFVWEWFVDGPPKAKPGTSPKDIGLRNLAIALLVKIVKGYGFPEYRNSEHRGETTGAMSACQMVAEETGFSERTVEAIWADRKAAVTSPQ